MVTNPRIFILEDDSARIEAFRLLFEGYDLTIAQWLNGAEGAYELFKPPYDLMLLDHDLGGQAYVSSDEDETGYQFVRWLGKAPSWNADVIVHSWNPDGRRAMAALLVQNGWFQISGSRVWVIEFGPKLTDWIRGWRLDTAK